MRFAQIVMMFLTVTFFAHQAAASETCRISKGEGTAIGRGPSKKVALENARLECGLKRVDGYIAMRGSIPQDVEDRFIDECANATCDR